jgi:hypothetical protein
VKGSGPVRCGSAPAVCPVREEVPGSIRLLHELFEIAGRARSPERARRRRAVNGEALSVAPGPDTTKVPVLDGLPFFVRGSRLRSRL